MATRRKTVKQDAIVISPVTNFILTFIFMGEIFAVLFTLGVGSLPPSCPLAGPTAAVLQFVYCICLFGVISFIKRGSAMIGRVLSHHIFIDDPLSKPKTMHKYQDQMWQLAIHVSMTLLELYVLYYENGEESWLTNYWDLWLPHPKNGQRTKASVHLVYFLQIGIWIDTCLLHRFVEERHKDYVLM